ncbi:MAG: hypothetical protein DRN66_02910 [Candidatus Nanohalarchaeota archaeon]|nr:MAG: hypothetical protein DRN66_02910 [Candidatus Nanohaloarchaeota archaeon]
MGILTLPATMEKIVCLVSIITFFGIYMAFSLSLANTQLGFHEMKGYKDALLVQFLHNPALAVLNEKKEPEIFMLNASKLSDALTNSPNKKVPNYDIGNTRYQIHIYDTQTGKYWDFKNYIPVDASFNISVDEKNVVWRYANIIYPNGNISTALVKAVYVIGENEDRHKLKEGMICNADEDCASDMYCTKGTGAGQQDKTCQSITLCTYSKNAGDSAESACECNTEETSGGKCVVGGPPLLLIKGQPCIGNAFCENGICNMDSAKPSEYYTCN